MNARAIKKRLMRGRASYLFGKRAWLAVKLPAAIAGTPPPRFVTMLPDGFEQATFSGMWRNEATDDCIEIHEWSCPDPSSERFKEFAEPWEHPLFVEKGRYCDDTWNCWVGSKSIPDGTDENGKPRYRHEPIADELVAAYRAEKQWQDKLHEYGNHPILDAFLAAGRHAKATDFNLERGGLEITYRVKWFYADCKFGFCRALSKALRAAKAAGIPAVIMKRG